MNDENKYESYQYGSNVNFVMRDPQPEHTGEEAQETTNKERKSKETKKKERGPWMKCVSMAVVFGLVASLVFQGSNRLFDGVFGKSTSGQEFQSTPIVTNNDKEVVSSVAEVATNVMPSVVSITNLSLQEVQHFFFGGYSIQESESSGSGIIIGQNEKELLIVSNNHVVEGSKTLTVSFVDGSSVEAQIKGTNRDKDLAIIAVDLSKIQESTMKDIKVANLGDSDALRVGEFTIAIGNALGYGQSVTYGIVSALDRTIDGFDAELIQTDAAINPGNSGGALLNANGEVIGINTVKVSDQTVEGMGYAIPITDVRDILNELMNKKTRTKVEEKKRGIIGISGTTVDESATELYGIPSGVYVKSIVEGGAAEKAGIPEGCIIEKFDGTTIRSMQELQEQLSYYEAGEKVELKVKVPADGGKYKQKTYEIVLGKQS